MALWDERLRRLQQQLSADLDRSLRHNETLLDLFNYLSPRLAPLEQV